MPAVSSILLLPALLPSRIQAGDLSSHLYNTWLVLRVKAGEPLGLEIVPQYSNVLFDWWLEAFWKIGGPGLAEKASVSLAVLLFFWGAFALVSRLGGRPAWASAPLLAILAYGWIYFQGFFNFYLSCAFSFWAFFFVAGAGWPRLLAIPALGLAALGHLLGAAVGGGLALFLLIRAAAGPKRRAVLLSAAVLALGLTALLAGLLFEARWDLWRFFHVLGVSPFLHDLRYAVAALPLILCWFSAGVRAWKWQAAGSRDPSATLATDAALLAAAAVLLLPASLLWPGTSHPLNFIGRRLDLWWTLLLHVALCRYVPPARVALCSSLAAILYFALLGQDMRRLNQVEDAFHRAVLQAPPDSRLVSLVTGQPAGLNPINHMIDRACIGRCFSYANYEPATGAFRLRARPGSPANMHSVEAVRAMQAGRYTVGRQDLPLYGIRRIAGPRLYLHVHALRAGETLQREVLVLDELAF